MLDKIQHEILLKRILRSIYQKEGLQNALAFKGGTCLYFFHELERFSTDLDFDLLPSKTIDPNEITSILEKYLTIQDFADKRYTLFWLGSFIKGRQKIKIEINKKEYPNSYDIHDFYGLSIKTMAKDTMFAHKLCAITDRKKLQNRDIFDAHFMFQKNFPINDQIIATRTKRTTKEYLNDLCQFLSKNITPNKVLDGLGEVLDEEKKQWVKKNLLNELIFEMQMRIKEGSR